jgi:hypothetical protein
MGIILKKREEENRKNYFLSFLPCHETGREPGSSFLRPWRVLHPSPVLLFPSPVQLPGSCLLPCHLLPVRLGGFCCDLLDLGGFDDSLTDKIGCGDDPAAA